MGMNNGKDLFGYSRWKNTPAGPVLDASLGDLIVAKLVEKTGNEKAKKVFDTLQDVRIYIDDNILAH